MVNSIGDKTVSIITSLPDKFGGLFDVLGKLILQFLGPVGSILTAITDIFNLIGALPDTFANFLKSLFIPTDANFSNMKQIFFNAFNDTFHFIEQIKVALTTANSGSGSLSIKFNFLTFGEKEINLDKFEGMRPYVRNGFSVIFWISTVFSIFRMISNVFGIGVKDISQGVYKESVSGSSNGGNKE
ncbi:MAG: hypothetical protein RR233_08235 [Clostridiales bacterium]